MAAHDNLSPQQFRGKYLYHETPVSNRDSIRRSGLRPSKPYNAWGSNTEVTHPPGVYMSQGRNSEYGSSMHDSSWYGYDRWRVHVGDLPVRRDPEPGRTTSWYHPENIPPERLQLVKKAHPDWEKHI